MFYLFAYFGPETSLPLLSGIMAVVGFAFMMGRNCFYFIGHRIRTAARWMAPASSPQAPARPLRKIGGLTNLNRPGSVEPSASGEFLLRG